MYINKVRLELLSSAAAVGRVVPGREVSDVVRDLGDVLYIYIYIYIYRERERGRYMTCVYIYITYMDVILHIWYPP